MLRKMLIPNYNKNNNSLSILQEKTKKQTQSSCKFHGKLENANP